MAWEVSHVQFINRRWFTARMAWKNHCKDGLGNHAGLLEENEQEEMQTLVEIRLSKLHFSAPHFALPSLESMLAGHPLFEQLGDEDLKKKV
jgi:hypothetical protein